MRCCSALFFNFPAIKKLNPGERIDCVELAGSVPRSSAAGLASKKIKKFLTGPMIDFVKLKVPRSLLRGESI
jgi:hypothetical protein